MSSLEKVLRLSGGPQPSGQPEGDALRTMVLAAHLALTEACQTENATDAAELVYAAAALVEDLAGTLYTDALDDWVEATACPDGSQLSLAGASAPYGDVPYADPGYLDGKKRYPIDEKHVKAAWGYINQAKNAARYTATQLSAIKGKIKAAMKSHGHGANIDAAAGQEPVLALMRDGEAMVVLAAGPAGDVAMGHAPMTGEHEHPHSVGMVHGHAHSHMGDNQHGGQMHGKNAGQKAWAAKGEAAWAADRRSY